MRTNEERIEALHKRATELKIEKRQKNIIRIQAAVVMSCVTVIVLIATFMPKYTQMITPDADTSSMRASIFAGNSILGFIVIGIIAFLLGISVTMFCYSLKKWQEDRDREDKE
ncbi:MAG: hypothetical protein IKS48_09845 [Eubacterium sp.]|nr:hypothetical protein [Eubacterium sp.]